MTEALKRKFKGRSILTTWDLSAEIYGNIEMANLVKIRHIYLNNRKEFEPNRDFLSATRQEVIDLGITIPRAMSRIAVYQVFTRSGAHKMLKLLGLEDITATIDDKFEDDDEEIVLESVVNEEVHVELESGMPENKPETKNEVTLFSESVLTLINYITTSKSLFDISVNSLEIGTVVLNTRKGIPQIITNMIDIPNSLDVMIQFVELQFDEESENWKIGPQDSFITYKELFGEGFHKPIAIKGVEFLLSLSDTNKTIEFRDSIDELQELYSTLESIQNRIDNRINSLIISEES